MEKPQNGKRPWYQSTTRPSWDILRTFLVLSQVWGVLEVWDRFVLRSAVFLNEAYSFPCFALQE
eukprot:1748663-Amphidinium_carterae.1